jgi:hypothetical protein
MIGAASGSTGGDTFSRNRYGAYVRRRAIPVASTTTEALAAKARFGNRSSGWAGITDPQREAWRQYALTNPITDALGQQQALTGHAAYVGINSRLDKAGDSLIADPPVGAGPTPLTSLTLSADIGAGTFDLTYLATPLAAGVRLWVQAALVDSTGITYVENLYKLVAVSSAAQASPLDIETEVAARFGTIQVGMVLFVKVATFDGATGLLSSPLVDKATVVST